MSLKALIFDLDNTLYDERDYIFGAYKEISKFVSKKLALKKTLFYKMLVDEFNERGSQYPYLFDDVLKKANIYGEGIIREVMDVYSSAAPKIKLYPGTEKVLARLGCKYSLGLITNGNIAVQRNKVKLLGVSGFFKAIIYARIFGKSNEKPDIMPYSEILGRLNVRVPEAIYVGDNPWNDFIGARKLGIKTLRLRKGEFADVVLSKEYEADYSMDELEEIFRFLE